MGARTTGKRPSQASQGPSKKRKLAPSKDAKAKKSKKSKDTTKAKGKERAFERPTIPIPNQGDEYEPELSDQDLDLLAEYGAQATFLNSLDEKGIARSKLETERLHRLNKPARQVVEDDLPSINSHSEDEDDWGSGIDDDVVSLVDEDSELSEAGPSSSGPQNWDSDEEMPYEAIPRKRRASWDASDEDKAVDRLPIKLADGRIQKTGQRIQLQEEVVDESVESDEEEDETPQRYPPREDVSTGARFGRPAVIDVIGNKSRKARLQAAKEQIANMCQEIVADPENNLGLLRRLHTFSLAEVTTPTHPEPVPNDPLVRKLAMLSQLAVFKDIIPGYRIRALTEKEQAEKVSQLVARTREWEQGLVGAYQTYLRALEAELKGKTALADTALRCMCALLTAATHFNFRTNLMSAVVAHLSRRSWDEASDLCLQTLVTVFRGDETGLASLEGVRLLNRMIKERRFRVHPTVLSCLLHLRLKTELGVRASQAAVERDAPPRGKKRDKAPPVHLSKKAKKALKERKEIEKEMKEAEAAVDREERTTNQTETLKLLFVLYFRILKAPHPTALLPAALQGIARFAHLVSIDFFRDLMAVLKELIARAAESDEPDAGIDARHTPDSVRLQLSCIVTAFELLSGQGEALNIDLGDFQAALYALLLPLALAPDAPAPTPNTPSTPDLLFRALHLALAHRPPPALAAAFAKRLLGAALHWPPAPAVRALDAVRALLVREPQLDALLAAETRAADGVYRPDAGDPALANAFASSLFELRLLAAHPDARVRAAAGALADFHRE